MMISEMDEEEQADHVSVKSLHISALGNAAQPSSYGHLESYLNTTDSHLQLRFSAVGAIRNYKHPEVIIQYNLIFKNLVGDNWYK